MEIGKASKKDLFSRSWRNLAPGQHCFSGAPPTHKSWPVQLHLLEILLSSPKSQACLLQRVIRYQDLIESVLEMKIPFLHHWLPGQRSAYQEHFIPGINFHQSFNTSCFGQKQTNDGDVECCCRCISRLKQGQMLRVGLGEALTRRSQELRCKLHPG